MALTEWISNNLPAFLAYLGIALLAVEILVLGLSVFILLFIGIACLLTSALIFVGLLPASVLVALVSVAVLTFASALVLWKPLKKMQDHVDKTKAQGDLVGHSFVLDSDISENKPGKHRYSGIEWQVVSDVPLTAGTKVQVVNTEVGKFTVSPAS